MSAPGLLVAFEGGDGSGKSTQAALLADQLGAVLTRQAGGTPFGARLREITLSDAGAALDIRSEALLFMADRAEHVDKVVRPALERGQHVVSDRWAYSSLVYQGYGRGLDVDELRRLADWAMTGLWPDAVIFLDIPIEVGAERRHRRNAEQDHFERASDGLQNRVLDGYRRLAEVEPHLWHRVEAQGSVDDVAAKVQAVIAPLLERATLQT